MFACLVAVSRPRSVAHKPSLVGPNKGEPWKSKAEYGHYAGNLKHVVLLVSSVAGFQRAEARPVRPAKKHARSRGVKP